MNKDCLKHRVRRYPIGMGGGDVYGIPEKSGIRSLLAVGNLEQNGTPTPSDPLPIVCNKGELKSVANSKDSLVVKSMNGYLRSSTGELRSYAGNSMMVIRTTPGVMYYVKSKLSLVSQGSTYVGYTDNIPSLGDFIPLEDVETITKGLQATESFVAKKQYATLLYRYDPDGGKTPEEMMAEVEVSTIGYVGDIYTEGDSYLTDSKSNVVNLPMLLKDDECFDDYTAMQRTVTHNSEAFVYDGTQTLNEGYISETGEATNGAIIVNPLLTPTTDTEAITDLLKKKPVTQTSEVDAEVTLNA